MSSSNAASREVVNMLISPVAAWWAGVLGRVPSGPGAGTRGYELVGSMVVKSGALLIDAANELIVPAIGAVDQSVGLPAAKVAPNGPRAIAAIVTPTVRIVTAMMLIRIR